MASNSIFPVEGVVRYSSPWEVRRTTSRAGTMTVWGWFFLFIEPHEEAFVSEYEEELEPRTKYPPKNQPLESFSLDKLCAVEIDLNPELTLHSKGHILLYKVTIQSRNEEPKMMVSVHLSKLYRSYLLLQSRKNAIKTRSRYDWSKKKWHLENKERGTANISICQKEHRNEKCSQIIKNQIRVKTWHWWIGEDKLTEITTQRINKQTTWCQQGCKPRKNVSEAEGVHPR